MVPDKRPSVVMRLTMELGVIVVGVLIALGLEASWSGAQDRRLEREVLASMSTDLRSVSVEIAELVTRDSVIVANSTAFLAAASDVTIDSVYVLLANLFSTVPIEPRLRTYDELVSSGQFLLLSNRDLRLLLAEFDASARLLAGYSAQMATQWNETARPALYRAISFEEMPVPTPTRGVRTPTQNSISEGRAKPRSDVPRMDVLRDPDVRNAVFDRGAFAAVHLGYVRQISDIVGRLTALVDAEPTL